MNSLRNHLIKILPLLALCILSITLLWLWWVLYRNLPVFTGHSETLTFFVVSCCIITGIMLLAAWYLFWKTCKKTDHLSGQSSKYHNNLGNSTAAVTGTRPGEWQWDILSGKLLINRQLAKLTGFTIQNNTPLNFDSWLALMSIEGLQQFNESLEHHVKLDNFKANSDIRLINSGKITIDSTNGLKFEFGFTIRLSRKLQIGSNALKKERPPKINIPDIFVGSTARILVLTNNIVNILVTQGLLNKLGLSSDVVTGKAEAYAALATTSYDLLFVDTEIQLIDCIELTNIIRDQNSTVITHNIPVIAMTSNTMTVDSKMRLTEAMDGSIAKPLSFKDVIEILTQHLTLPKRADRNKAIKELNSNETHLFEAIARNITQPNKSDNKKNLGEYQNWRNSGDVIDSGSTSWDRRVLLKCIYDEKHRLEQDISSLAEVPGQLHDQLTVADNRTRLQNLKTGDKTTNAELARCAAELEAEVNKLQEMITDTRY